jgi:hypothetical protein
MQDENKFNNTSIHQNYVEMKEGLINQGNNFRMRLEKYWELGRDEKFSLPLTIHKDPPSSNLPLTTHKKPPVQSMVLDCWSYSNCTGG